MKVSGFVGGSYVSQSAIAAGERCINLVPEKIPVGNKTQWALYPSPGVTQFAQLPQAPGRGIFFERGRLFAVGGNHLYEIDEAGTPTERGELLANSNPVTWATNGDGGEELLVTSGLRGDILELDSNTFVPGAVSDIGFSGQLDGFLVGLDTTTSTLKISEFLDGQTWTGTQIAQRTAASDPWLAMLVVGNEIWLIGEKTGEVWFNAGSSPFPFQRRQGVFFEYGIIAPYTLTPFAGSLAWLGRNKEGTGGVYWMQGYQVDEISTPALRWAIQAFEDTGDISNAVAWAYERDGHKFLVLTFPTQRRTFVFDATTRLWHERGTWEPNENDFLAYRPQFHAVGFGRNLVCDSGGDKIWSLSSTVYTDVDGGPLRRLRRFGLPTMENKRIAIPAAELECSRGIGNKTGEAGDNPKAVLRYSRDGGMTFGNNRERSQGQRGKYKTRVRWNRLGQGRDWKFELWASDPVPQHWLDFYVTVKGRALRGAQR